jgi:hypothetical protein
MLYTLKPGDVLTACDNEMAIPPGYLGHSAIVINDKYSIEAVITPPYIRVIPTTDFLESHPRHAIFRPRDEYMGRMAAEWAIRYYQFSESNRIKGYYYPPFSFSTHVPLMDPYTSTYCSKLVWLSYYYGAGYPFPNDHYLFTPEDVFTVLSNDPSFITLYKHPNFQFVINT